MRKFEVKKKKEYERCPNAVWRPDVIDLSDEDEACMDIREETEDLEQHTEEEKTQDLDISESSKDYKKSDRKKLLALDKHEKRLLKFRYCTHCDNLRPPRADHCEM